MSLLAGALAVLMVVAAATSLADEIVVNSNKALRSAMLGAKPGTVILVAAGDYSGGLHMRDVSGEPDAPITIRGEAPDNLPVFSGGAQAIHFSDCNYLNLADLIVDGFTKNGLNCDDGGTTSTPMRHLIVENVTVTNIGPHGNHDGLKMSGVDQFIVRNCRFVGWGGSAIDMVGCHRGVVEDC